MDTRQLSSRLSCRIATERKCLRKVTDRTVVFQIAMQHVCIAAINAQKLKPSDRKGQSPQKRSIHVTLYITKGKFGGAKRDRTADLLHAMQALSQLSYSPNLRDRRGGAKRAVRRTGRRDRTGFGRHGRGGAGPPGRDGASSLAHGPQK